MDEKMPISLRKGKNKVIPDGSPKKSRNESSKTNKKEENAKIENNKEIKYQRPSTSVRSKNINSYRYLFDNRNKESKDYSNWVINLRFFDKAEKRPVTSFKEPKFYQDDLNKYIKRRSKTSKKSIIYPNFTRYKHFFQRNEDSHGTSTNEATLYFNLTLRNNNSNALKKWDSVTSTANTNYMMSRLPLDERLNEKYLIRPYNFDFKKENYNGQNIITKKVLKDKVKAFNYLGSHLVSPSYNDNYVEKDFNKVRGLFNVDNKNQTNIWYILKLRQPKKDIEQQNKQKKWKN